MSSTTPRRGRRFASALTLLGVTAAIMLGQAALPATAQAASSMSLSSSVKVAAKAPTRIVVASRTYEMPRVPVTGTLYTRNNRAVAGQRVQIYTRDLNSRTWRHVGSATTNAHGQFTAWIKGVNKTRYYQVRFPGTSRYSGSTSNTAHINATQVHTRVTAGGIRTSVPFAAGFDIRGTLLDSHGRRLAGQRVELWSKTLGSRTWTKTALATTSRSGSYVISLRNLSLSRDYQVRYQGAPIYTKSVSATTRTIVGTLATTVSATSTATSVPYGYGVIVSGHLVDARGMSLAAQRVSVYGWRSGATAWSLLGSTSTNAAGNYSFNTGGMTVSTTVQARFAGAAPRAASSSKTTAIAVGAKPPVTTTPPPSSPPVTNPPPVTTPPPPVTTPPAAPATWVSDPELAAATADQINQYRASQSLSTLAPMDATATDACVVQNTTGGSCDPGNAAWGYLTAPAVVTAWENSPEHNATMVVPEWVHLACSAYVMSDGSNAVVGCSFDF